MARIRDARRRSSTQSDAGPRFEATFDSEDELETQSMHEIRFSADLPPRAEPPVAPRFRHALVMEYGEQWEWSDRHLDYIQRTDGGHIRYYTDYQRLCREQAAWRGGQVPPQPTGTPAAPHPLALRPRPSPSGPPGPPGYHMVRKPVARVQEAAQNEREESGDGWLAVQNLARRGSSASDSDGQIIETPLPRHPKLRKPYAEALDKRFRVVEKPKRFFTEGRVFKTVWFEPGAPETPIRPGDREWTNASPAFHEVKPHAKFRYFIVARKRLNHSLCFSVTTYGGQGSTKTRRGRAVDFVVLFSSDVEPPKPYDEEDITRKPLAIIIEEADQFISPLARLDCSRLYTVEDNLRVMKIGRLHQDSLPLLEEYYQEAVK